MKESYVEDLASHDGPVHALATREGAAKRWMRGACRPAIEPRNRDYRGADVVDVPEGNTAGGALASRQRTPRGRRTCACVRSLLAENRDLSRSPARADGPGGSHGEG
jgi:hypothetical protein